ncbi:MAG TPA: winged helix-turn-helix domain-containing protein [Candidatus Angelobacter sp.]|nr:winged helix-turn-helix domain-containing protein [Candidatus Angelobacter sp.]
MAQELQFGDFTLDQSGFRLQRGTRVLRLEKRPMELLILLAERRGELVSREEIAERLWGKDVFVDVDHSINTAVRKVRLVLRDEPDKPRYVETVVGRGYRFAAPVICNNGESSTKVETLVSLPPQAPPEPAVPSAEAEHRSVRPRLLLGVAILLVLVAVAGVWYRGLRAKPAGPPAIKSIAVLPLKNLSGDPTQDYLADGMTEELIGRLSGIHDLRVISRTSSMQFKNTKLSVPEIAKTLNVDALVEGSVMRDGNRIRVHAQLIRAANDEHFWSEEYDRELPDVLALESDVAQSIADKVAVTVSGQERSRLVAARQVSPQAYDSYLKGSRLSWGNSKADVEQGIASLEEAIRQDPTFAPAYVGLAFAYDGLASIFLGAPPQEMRSKAISAARKALELDPELADAHTLLAGVYQEQWKWAEAESEYKRALDLNPNDAGAIRGFATWLLCQGRTEEAVTWSRRADEIDPLDDSGYTGFILFGSRRYDDAIRESKMILAIHPESAMANWILGYELIGNGQSEDAIPVLEKTVLLTEHSPGVIGLLATAYAYAGHRTEALRLIDELKKRRETGYVPAAAFINAYLGLGDYDEAFVWFERAYQEQSNILQLLKVYPFFDPVRNDPRFVDLVRRVGLN